MTDDTHRTTFSGDVTLAGNEPTPVAVRDPADAFLQRDSVAGDLEVSNPEYVYTHQPPDGDADVADAETTVRGDIEDGYAVTGGVDGPAVIADAEDVFVSADAVAGGLSVVGAENVYADDAGPDLDPGEYDVCTVGWEQSDAVDDPEIGVYVTGVRHEVSAEHVRRDVTVYVVGRDHEVSLDGRNAAVTVHLLGTGNTVRVGPYLAAEVATDTGSDNEVVEEPYPVGDLIEMSKDEAFANAGFGRRKVTYQMPATDEEWCPNCGEPADAIIERHQMEAFFLLNTPIWTYDRSTNPAKECERCSPNANEVRLTERERRDVLQ
jgi:hypothetical protein